jgi:hypothetical protein
VPGWKSALRKALTLARTVALGSALPLMTGALALVPCQNCRGARVAWYWCSSGGSLVFVDHAAEDLPPVDRCVEWDDGCGVVVGWAVPAALVRPVVVEVSGVFVEDCRGVAFVVDEILSVHSDRTLRMNRSA